MNDLAWNDLRLFCHVAREGTLSGAAERTGISAPTLGRAMRALEAQTGRALFSRHRTGYRLLPDGQALYDRARGVEASARAIEDWREGAHALPIVTVVMGVWMSVYLGGRLNAVWTPEDRFRLCFKISETPVYLERCEDDIALARERQLTGNVVALGREVAQTPAERWTDADRARWITVWANARGIFYDLTAAGQGARCCPAIWGIATPIWRARAWSSPRSRKPCG